MTEEVMRTVISMEEVKGAVTGEVFGVWFLIGAALVFWMQAGFAMAEAGFTRAKNTGNIIMKNLMDFGITGMTVSHVMGCGIQKGTPEYYRGVPVEASLLPKVQVDIVVSKVPVRSVIETAKKVLYTGHIGDGKIFVYDVENVVKVRTGEEGCAALQDVE